MIAALYVQKGGVYYGLDDVDPWDESRDARLYDGPWPVVAHPPCARWCRLAGLVEARFGHVRGDDGGCFAAALEAVRRFGGVLEHPADSGAWSAYDLPVPLRDGGWTSRIGDPGWSAYVEQFRYGHVVRKATWLYAVGVELPALRWGRRNDQDAWESVSWTRPPSEGRERVGAKRAAATPTGFRDVLLSMARSASREFATS